jgi:hypothetical protein
MTANEGRAEKMAEQWVVVVAAGERMWALGPFASEEDAADSAVVESFIQENGGVCHVLRVLDPESIVGGENDG